MKKLKGNMSAAILAAALLVNYALLAYGITAVFRQDRTNQSQPPVSNEEKILESDNTFVQNNEDLLDADYKNFYEDLKPYGTWIEVNLKNKSTESGTNPEQKNLSDALINVLGIKDAKADANVGWSVFFVWQPSPGMAVSIAAGDPAPAMYVPYTDGQWVYTDYGWYFRAGTRYEEITHHYGRWVYVVPYGWIWIPGNRWAPAWVTWDYDDDYIAWTPGSPGLYFAVNYYGLPYRLEPAYVVCERRHFLEPYVYRYSGFYREHDFGKKFRDMESRNGNLYAGGKHFGFGPDVKRIEKDYGRRIDPVRINTVHDPGKVKYGDKQFSVYAPKLNGKQNSKIFDKSGSERELKHNNRNSLSSGTEKKSPDKQYVKNFSKDGRDKSFNRKISQSGSDKFSGKNNRGFNNFGKNNDRINRENYNRRNDRVSKSPGEKIFRQKQDNGYKQNNKVYSGYQKGNGNKTQQNFGRNENRNSFKEQKGGQRGHR